MHTQDEWLRDQKDSVEAKIERAFEQFEGNEFFSAEQSRADMEERKRAFFGSGRPGGRPADESVRPTQRPNPRHS